MNLLPLIHHNRKRNFISPLSGTMIQTQQFRLKDPTNNDISTISFMNQSPTNLLSTKLRSTRTEHKLKQSYLEQIDRTERKRFKNTSKRFYHTLDASQHNESKALITPRVIQERSSLNFMFPKVQIVPLHLITRHQDIKTMTLSVNLQPYFRLLFNQKIVHTNKELNEILLKYFQLISTNSLLHSQIVKQKWPSEFWQAKTTEDLLKLMRPYVNKSSYWDKYIYVLMRLYCLPEKQIRKTIMDNLLLMISKQIAAKMKGKGQICEMMLLKDDGTPVGDIIEVPFNAKILYLAKKSQLQNGQFQKFLEMEKLYEIQCKKSGFISRLRNHFRKEIVPNKYDEESINYHLDFQVYKKEREDSLDKASKLLQTKKQKSRNNITDLSRKHPKSLADRPKSKQSLWRQQNVQDSKVHPERTNEGLHFNINLGNKRYEEEIKNKFHYYHQLSKRQMKNLGDKQLLIVVLERQHPVLKNMTEDHFNSSKLMKILEVITESKMPQEHSTKTIEWKNFVELEVLTSKNIRKFVNQNDCYQILRNFAEGYLGMKEEDYFREELVSKVYRSIEGDKEGLGMMEDVIWNWLESNGFVKHDAIQRELLWNYPARSKTFYLLIASMALGTFQTTPLDLAHELLY